MERDGDFASRLESSLVEIADVEDPEVNCDKLSHVDGATVHH